MLRRIPKVLLLMALLAAFAASIAPTFGRAGTCRCHPLDVRQLVLIRLLQLGTSSQAVYSSFTQDMVVC